MAAAESAGAAEPFLASRVQHGVEFYVQRGLAVVWRRDDDELFLADDRAVGASVFERGDRSGDPGGGGAGVEARERQVHREFLGGSRSLPGLYRHPAVGDLGDSAGVAGCAADMEALCDG